MKLSVVFVALLGLFAASAVLASSAPYHPKPHKVKKHKGVKHRA
jgi:hypothetical protein